MCGRGVLSTITCDLDHREEEIYQAQTVWRCTTTSSNCSVLCKTDVVEYLLKMGDDTPKLDSQGRTPHFWAETGDFADVGSYSSRRGVKR